MLGRLLATSFHGCRACTIWLTECHFTESRVASPSLLSYAIGMSDAEPTTQKKWRRLKRRKRRHQNQRQAAAKGQGIPPQIEEELLLAARQAWMQLLRKRPPEEAQGSRSKTARISPSEELPAGPSGIGQARDGIGGWLWRKMGNRGSAKRSVGS